MSGSNVGGHTNEHLCVDDFVVNPGDGKGHWFVFVAAEDDGPIAEFYGQNAEADARRVVDLWNKAIASPKEMYARDEIDKTLAQLAAANERVAALEKERDGLREAIEAIRRDSYLDDDTLNRLTVTIVSCAALKNALAALAAGGGA